MNCNYRIEMEIFSKQAKESQKFSIQYNLNIPKKKLNALNLVEPTYDTSFFGRAEFFHFHKFSLYSGSIHI